MTRMMAFWSSTGIADGPISAQGLTDPCCRKKRFDELSSITAASVYNQVYHLQKPDYSKDVTEASNKAYVFVLLTSSQGTNVESRILIEIWRELAQRFGDVKFCQIRGDLCIEGYPDKNTPTVLVYKDGDIKRQIVTLRELHGTRTATTGALSFSAPLYLPSGSSVVLNRGHPRGHVQLITARCPISNRSDLVLSGCQANLHRPGEGLDGRWCRPANRCTPPTSH